MTQDLAIKAVILTLPSLLVSLDREASENNEPTAHGLLNFMKCYMFVACVYLLSDVLPRLSCISLIFKKQDVNLLLMQHCLKSNVDSIKQYKDAPGPNLGKLDDVLANELRDFDNTSTDRHKAVFKSSIHVKHIEAIISPDADNLDTFCVFDPQVSIIFRTAS